MMRGRKGRRGRKSGRTRGFLAEIEAARAVAGFFPLSVFISHAEGGCSGDPNKDTGKKKKGSKKKTKRNSNIESTFSQEFFPVEATRT